MAFDFKTPNYADVFLGRAERLRRIRANPELLTAARIHYKTNPIDFIQDWFFTFDPRKKPSLIPFILFPKQKEFILWLLEKYEDREEGLVEKSRDAGATWLCMAFSLWLWTFHHGTKIGFGSRKANLVDNLSDPDSIFEKGRIVLRNLPSEFLPRGFDIDRDALYMRIINRQNGSSIVGESGDNIGRGGRSSMYFKDESAFYERADRIEAALSQNSDVKIDVSTPNGNGNPFYRKRFSGVIDVFTFHWRDDPRKDDAWYQRQVERLDPVTVAQEIDIDYSASVEGICIPAKWVRAAVNLELEPSGKKVAGLDVADEGGDENVYLSGHGVVVQRLECWREGNTTQTARRAYRLAKEDRMQIVNYDNIGVGAGVKGEASEIKRRDTEKKYDIVFSGINVGLPPTPGYFEQGKKNKDMFANLKAQLVWELRRRFERTYEHVNGIKQHDADKLISIPDDPALISEISQVKVETNEAGKIKIESKKSLARRGIKSPNRFEALYLRFAKPNLSVTNVAKGKGLKL
ncbi:MAG: TerL protein [Chloroflexota bacterium]|nr:TerL protein [Chloroflexota bacterium]